MIVRLIIIGLLVFFLARLIRTLLLSDGRSPPSTFRDGGERMVNDMAQDPECGVYVDTKQALSARAGHKTVYFCSEKCRKKYLQG